MKTVGILVGNLQNEFSLQTNALLHNCFLLYDLLERSEHYHPVLIDSESQLQGDTQFGRCIPLDTTVMKEYGVTAVLEAFIRLLPVHHEAIRSQIPEMKFIAIEYGNRYWIDICNWLYMEPTSEDSNPSASHPTHDAVWISPHFEETIEYFKMQYRTESVHVCPYIWSPKLIEARNQSVQYKPHGKRNVGIFEANLHPIKTSIIPLMIAEKTNTLNPDIVEQVHVCNVQRFVKTPSFQRVAINTSLAQQKKLRLVAATAAIPRYYEESDIGVIVSHNFMNGLNYLHLEALWMGIPLVHNSEWIRDAGYFYEGFDISSGAKSLEKALTQHDPTRYQQAAQNVLWRFSVDNPENMEGYEKLLHNVLETP